METKEVKQLVLVRVPPGDCWTDAIELDSVPMVEVDDGKKIPLNMRREECERQGYIIINSLTEALEYLFVKSKYKWKEFHLSAFDGKIFHVTTEEVEPEPEPEPRKFNLYGEF